ncbi:DUF2147 domain-containing protein [Sphingomonas sp. CJ20]
MKPIARLILGFGIVAALTGAAAPPPPEDVWRNPSGSVHIRFSACGAAMCGTVVWASEKAKADALKGAKEPLIGTQIFRDFEEVKPGTWRGRVYVPDINQTFFGTVTRLDKDRLLGKGCVLFGAICKSQTWTRIAP